MDILIEKNSKIYFFVEKYRNGVQYPKLKFLKNKIYAIQLLE